MKEIYEAPAMEIVAFDTEDVIATSQCTRNDAGDGGFTGED